MEIITSAMRCLLFISGLDPAEFWEHALEHAVNLQLRTALPERCTPYELTHGRRPNVLNLRIFGCEALAYIEKDKRKKLQPKVHKTIYLGFSDHHNDHTYKLYDMKSKQIIYCKNVYFNERRFPARETKHITPSQHTWHWRGPHWSGLRGRRHHLDSNQNRVREWQYTYPILSK